MKANTYLKSSVYLNAAVIEMTWRGNILFIGATCETSVPPFSRGLSSITITGKPGEDALVAVKTHPIDHRARIMDPTVCLIPVTWDGMKMILDFEHPFVPRGDRLVQINGCDILVTAEQQRFSTCCDEWDKESGDNLARKRRNLIGKGYRLVDDPNLLLRFAIGKATLEDLEAAATLDQRSQTERELAQCRQQLEREIDTRSRAEQEVAHGRQCLELMYAEHEKKIDLYQRQLENEIKEASKFASYVVRYTDFMIKAKKILANAGNQNTLFGLLPWVKLGKLAVLFAGMDKPKKQA